MPNFASNAVLAVAAPVAAFMPVHQEQAAIDLSDDCGPGFANRMKCFLFKSRQTGKKECLKDVSDLSMLQAAVTHHNEEDLTQISAEDVKMYIGAQNALLDGFAAEGESELLDGSHFMTTHNGGSGQVYTPILCHDTPATFGASSSAELAEDLVQLLDKIVTSLRTDIQDHVETVIEENDTDAVATTEGLTSEERDAINKLGVKVDAFADLVHDEGISDREGKSAMIDEMTDLRHLVQSHRMLHALDDNEVVLLDDLNFHDKHANLRFKFSHTETWKNGVLTNGTTTDGARYFELCGVEGTIENAANNNDCGVVFETEDGFLFKISASDPLHIRLARSADINMAFLPLGVALDLKAISEGVDGHGGVKALVNKYALANERNEDGDETGFPNAMKRAVNQLMRKSDAVIEEAAQGLNSDDAASWHMKLQDDVEEDSLAYDLLDFARKILALDAAAMSSHDIHHDEIKTFAELQSECRNTDNNTQCIDGEVFKVDGTTFKAGTDATGSTIVEEGFGLVAEREWISASCSDSSFTTEDSCGSCTDTYLTSDSTCTGVYSCCQDSSGGDSSKCLTSVSGMAENDCTSQFVCDDGELVSTSASTCTGDGSTPVAGVAVMNDWTSQWTVGSCSDPSTSTEGRCTGSYELPLTKLADTSIHDELAKATLFTQGLINNRTEQIEELYTVAQRALWNKPVNQIADSIHEIEFQLHQLLALDEANDLLGLHLARASKVVAAIQEEVRRAKEEVATQGHYAAQTPQFSREVVTPKNDVAAGSGKYWIQELAKSFACNAGSYSNAEKATSCILCPAGQYSNAVGASDDTDCSDCPASGAADGTAATSTADRSACNCDSGYVWTVSSGSCDASSAV